MFNTVVFEINDPVLYKNINSENILNFKGVMYIHDRILLNSIFLYILRGASFVNNKGEEVITSKPYKYLASELIFATPEQQLEYKLLEAAGIQ